VNTSVQPVFAFADFELHGGHRELRRSGQPVPVEPKVLDVLLVLVRNRSRLVSRTELLDTVWADVVVSDSALARAVREARRALGDDGEGQRFIKTLHGRGYRFVAATSERGPVPAADQPAPAASDPVEPIVGDDFVGRDDALRRFSSMLSEGAAGRGSALLVSGEPGIGKTRVLEKFAIVAAARGFVAHLARCSEADGVPALWPFEQVVRAELALLDASSMTPAQRRAVGEVAQLARDAAGRLGVEPVPMGDGAEVRFRLFADVARFLTTAASQRPRAVLVDDLHLADGASLALLQQFLPEALGAPVVIVATMRDDRNVSVPLARTIAALARRSPRGTLRLTGLDVGEVARFVHAFSPRTLEPREVEALTARTGGNPLFLTHLLAQLEEDGDVAGPALARTPAALREAIDRTLAAISPETVRALALASVVGPTFRVPVLAAAAGDTPVSLLDTIGEAVDAGVLRAAASRRDTYEFVHVLLRDVLYSGIPHGQRARMHAEVGDAVRRIHAGSVEDRAEELAHHYLRAAAAGKSEDAVHFATIAADHAVGRAAYEHAAALYTSALEVLDFAPDDGRRARLLVRLGSALGRDGRIAEAGEAFRDAADVQSPSNRDAGLSSFDVRALRESFHRIVERTPTVTTRFYQILFDRHPEAHPLFRRNAPEKQARMMNDTLMAIVDRLEDAPWLKASLAALGAKHVEYGIADSMYAWVGGALLAALAEAAGEAWTPRVARAWTDAFHEISRMMIEGAHLAVAAGVVPDSPAEMMPTP
jgi:DNA-binding winged helix-turn-helix (wHTH) protein/hemoglobin-like flavoprotein